MSAIKSGRTPSDRELFEKLLSYSRLVFHICLGFAADPLDAEELYQEVYLKAWNDLGSLRIHDSGREWLLKIARNTGLNHVRKKRLNPGGPWGANSPSSAEKRPNLPSFGRRGTSSSSALCDGCRRSTAKPSFLGNTDSYHMRRLLRRSRSGRER